MVFLATFAPSFHQPFLGDSMSCLTARVSLPVISQDGIRTPTWQGTAQTCVEMVIMLGRLVPVISQDGIRTPTWQGTAQTCVEMVIMLGRLVLV